MSSGVFMMEKPENCEMILEIKEKTSVTIIKEFTENGAKIQFNSVGESKGLYEAKHTETVDLLLKMDGSSEWESRAIDVTKEGEVIMLSAKGMGRGNIFQGELSFMTGSKELSWLNNSKSYIEGSSDPQGIEASMKVYAVKMAEAVAPM